MSSSRRSRQERYRELYADLLGDEELVERLAFDADEEVREENEQLWALYREVADSQREALEELDPMIEVSQSTASRVLREMEEGILTEPVLTLDVDLHEDDLEHYPGDFLEAYREVVAKALVDLLALQRLGSPETKNPEWAADRFPDLVGVGTEVGRAWGMKESQIVDEGA